MRDFGMELRAGGGDREGVGVREDSAGRWSARMLRGLAVAAAVAALCASVRGQEGAVGQAIATLHVYADLLQVPVLVLGQDRKPTGRIGEERFLVSLDSGPLFRATHVRREGEDAISLSILLDTRGDAKGLMGNAQEAVAKLAPEHLQAKDHVSIYALDCTLVETMSDQPAEGGAMSRAVAAVLAPSRARAKSREPCAGGVHLWDALAIVTSRLSGSQGRRVVLLVTDGTDGGSSHAWTDVKVYAQARGVAVFAVRPVVTVSRSSSSRTPGFSAQTGAAPEMDRLGAMCELTGGLVLDFGPSSFMNAELRRFVLMVRDRYIVEFPRPLNGSSGQHDLAVSLVKKEAFIRPAGISFPLRDPASVSDPTTLPPDPAKHPEQGTRRILSAPH